MRQTNHVKKMTPFRAVCLEKGYTKDKVAKILNVTPRTAYAYMIGERIPSRQVMQIIKDKMEVNPLDLFVEEKGESNNGDK